MTASITAAARAAYENHRKRLMRETPWEELHHWVQEEWCADMRAALAAIKVPSEAMLDAATTSQERRALFAVQWTYAIDALLSEEP